MNWLEEKVAYTLTYSAPKGFGVNPKVLRPISKRLIKTEGICPCAHDEWNESTPIEDKCCPCKTFRESGECHCGLYVKLHLKE
jgi:ferredoxin-thioredoxin reductase catalytic subunit